MGPVNRVSGSEVFGGFFLGAPPRAVAAIMGSLEILLPAPRGWEASQKNTPRGEELRSYDHKVDERHPRG